MKLLAGTPEFLSSVEFVWTERDGPPTKADIADGSGLSLIRGEIEHSLGGRVETAFEPRGLSVTFSILVTTREI